MIVQFLLSTGSLFAQTQEINSTPTQTPSPGELKKLSLEELMDLDVTSVANEPQPYGQAPAAIEVITNDEIRRSGASSIPEALRLADNLEVEQDSSSGWNISARGFNVDLANKLLVMIDGRTVYTPLYSGVYWNAQDYLLEDIDRIEVVSGPGGALWGANAVNGVINITSKDAKDTQGAYVETGGGTQLQDFVGARYGGTLAPDIYYRFYAKYFNEGAETFSDGGGSAQDSWNMGQGGFRIDDEADPRDKFTLQGDLYNSFLNVFTGIQENFAGGNILGRWSRVISDDSNMSLQLYYDRTYAAEPVAASVFADGLDTYDLDFQHHFSVDSGNQLTWGLGYRFTHDVVLNVPILAFLPGTLDHQLFSVFAQDEIKLWADILLTVGSKVEHNDYTGYEFEPSARLKWDLAEKQMLWVAVSRAVRMPSRIDRDVSIPPLLDGGSGFQSEILVAYELGYRAQLTREWATSLSTFFNNYDDLRSFSPTPGTIYPVTIANGLAGQTYGLEFTTDYQVSSAWQFHAGYDLLKENIWVKPGQTDLDNGTEDTADPQNQAFLRSSMDLPGNLELDPALRWVDTIFNFNGTTTTVAVPSYLEMDVQLSWHPVKDLELSVTGQNLLQPYHLEYGSGEEIARSVYGKVACKF
ncbi:MAG TPA: TonB-dependent receptor [bacterium]|nr:TonB-dependent receptor [bacterium]